MTSTLNASICMAEHLSEAAPSLHARRVSNGLGLCTFCRGWGAKVDAWTVPMMSKKNLGLGKAWRVVWQRNLLPTNQHLWQWRVDLWHWSPKLSLIVMYRGSEKDKHVQQGLMGFPCIYICSTSIQTHTHDIDVYI
jgi:hypothetical protein